ncbi:MAG TPA: CDP-diacylglycerol--glycerol-3-phosphate 3-phosphatidyltransferase [Chloroflexota bacterium]|jgi:CDP-diacylglycerol--glycerol-3-phosphate 3-phosphatidyltransferase|nr:CDP-diacylglycerol--glycerol-3-phosphate 3-phosphatidyltransferase [Chloroflexota bacterium]
MFSASREQWLTAANGATLARVAAIPAILLLLATPGSTARWGAAALFVGAALTDVLDGHLARSRAAVSPLGAALDLTADKLLIAAALIELGGRQLVPAWVVPVILFRELLVAGLRWYAGRRGQGVPAHWSGKLKMAVTTVAITAAILEAPAASWLLTVAAGLTVVSALPYVVDVLVQAGEPGGARGAAPQL